MKNFKIIALFLLSILFSAETFSQNTVSIHFGPSFPMSDFATDNIEEKSAGGAGIGINIGLQYVYPLSENGIGLFAGIDFNYNELKKSVKEDIKKYYESSGVKNINYKFYKYINVPITAGFNYSSPADDKIRVFLNAGIAMNYLKMTDMKVTVNGRSATTDMHTAYGLGFKIGGGIHIYKKIFISVDYLGLGTHSVSGTAKSSGYYNLINGDVKVDLLTLTLGFNL